MKKLESKIKTLEWCSNCKSFEYHEYEEEFIRCFECGHKSRLKPYKTISKIMDKVVGGDANGNT